MSKFLTLNIGASKAVLAEYALSGKNNLTLNAYGQAPLIGIDPNDPGSLAAALPSVLHQIMREKAIKPAPLIVSLGGQTVFPRFAKFPPVNDTEKLDQLVRYEIEQNVPFPIDEIVSDYQFLGETPDGDKAAMIVAAKLENVRAVTDAVRSAGLRPTTVDVSPIAICNALKFSTPDLSGCTVVLDIGLKTTSLIILEGEKIYNRSIPVGGNTITKELAQTFQCSMEEAEQIKLERGYVALGGVTEDEDEISDRVSKVIRTVLTRLHAEISRSINFYRSQQGGSAPSRLFLTGGCARLAQIDQFFTDSLRVEVEFLNPFVSINFGSKVNTTELETDAFALTESVGLALRETDKAWISLSLMPPELIDEERAMKRIPFLAAGGVAVIAALALAWLTQSHGVDVANARIECLENRNSALSTLDAKLKKEMKTSDEERAKCEEFQKLLRDRSGELRRLRAVRESLEPGMWITDWQQIAPKKDVQGALPVLRITVRGWADAMKKAVGDKKMTVAEMVQQKLKGRAVFVSDSVKIVAQKSVKECLTEFVIEMNLAPGASIIPEAEGRKGKAAKK